MAFKPIEILINAKDNASAVFGSLQTKVAAVGAAIATYFGINAFAGVVRGAADLETAMSRVQAATGATGQEMQALRKAAEDAGSNTKFTSTEAAGALENLAKAGLSAQDSIAALPAVLNLAQAGDIGLAEASETVTKAVMGMGLAFTDAARVADVLALGANATNTSVQGLAQALSYAAPVAQSAGLSLEATVAIMGKLADAGIDASRSGTAVAGMLAQFADPASAFRRELAAAGITTTDFEKALHQLAAAGPAGEKAILAVGLNAGPALRALLNQGMTALDDLKLKLDNAAGSAAATAATMQNNLNGSLSGLASAWDTVKNTLGTPVLPVLKEGVDQLAGAFRAAVADGTVQRFGESIATAFRSGIQWVRDFMGTVDFTAVLARLQAFADSTNQTLTKVGEYATNAGHAVQAAWGVMATGANVVLTAIYGVGTAFTETAAYIVKAGIAINEQLQKIAIGDAKERIATETEQMRLVLEGLGDASNRFSSRMRQSFIDAGDSAQLARDGFAGLAGSTADAEKAATAGAAAFDDMGKRLEEVRQKSHDAGAAAEKKAQQDLAAKKATEEHAAAIAKLGDEYRTAVASGDWQKAAELQDKLNQKLRETPPIADEIKQKMKATADAVDAAYRDLGIVTDASLREAANRAKASFDTLLASGQASARELAQGFVDAANKAIAANDGIAPAWVRAQASVRGFRVEADDTGKSIVVSMEKAEDAVSNVGKAAKGTAPGFKTMGDAAEKAGEKLEELRKKEKRRREENKGGGSGEGGGGGRPYGGGHSGGANPLSKSNNDPENVLEYYKKYLPTSNEDFEKELNKSRANVSGNASLTKEYIDAQIAKMYGEQFIGDADAEAAFNAKIKLDAYRTNYGNVVRSQESLNEQHALLQAVQRLEEKLRARAAEDLKKAAALETAEAATAPPTRSGFSSGGGGIGGRGAGQPVGGPAMGPQGGISIVINANGVNDPVKLARLLEPELQKIHALRR